MARPLVPRHRTLFMLGLHQAQCWVNCKWFQIQELPIFQHFTCCMLSVQGWGCTQITAPVLCDVYHAGTVINCYLFFLCYELLIYIIGHLPSPPHDLDCWDWSVTWQWRVGSDMRRCTDQWFAAVVPSSCTVLQNLFTALHIVFHCFTLFTLVSVALHWYAALHWSMMCSWFLQ